jgi:hypothetical protein
MALNTWTAGFVPVTVTLVTGNFTTFVRRSVVRIVVIVRRRVTTNAPPVFPYSDAHTPSFDTEPIVIPPIHGHTRSILRNRL